MPRKQLDIPGTEPVSIKEIEEAADRYVTVRDKRMKLTEQEAILKTALIQAVEDHKSEISSNGSGEYTYRFDDLLVILTPGKETVKVKTVHDDTDSDEE